MCDVSAFWIVTVSGLIWDHTCTYLVLTIAVRIKVCGLEHLPVPLFISKILGNISKIITKSSIKYDRLIKALGLRFEI